MLRAQFNEDRHQGGGLLARQRGFEFMRLRDQQTGYASTVTAGVTPSFFARRANLRSSNVATAVQDR